MKPLTSYITLATGGSRFKRDLLVLILALLAVISVVNWPWRAARADETGAQVGPLCFYQNGYLTCVQRAGPDVWTAAQASSAQDLLAALLAGPTPDESAQGVGSAIPNGTRLASVESEGQAITVYLTFPPGYLWATVCRVESLWAGATASVFNPAASDAIVQQIAATLMPLGYLHLTIKAEDPGAPGVFRPLADYTPTVNAPAKPSDGGGPIAPESQPPVQVRDHPLGALSGKTVYISAGHGWYWSGSAWLTQRPPYPDASTGYSGPIIEDHNNAEVVNQYLLRYLWNAGADVWSVRERDMHTFESIVDNGAAGFGATGGWQSADGGAYLTATTELAATASAIWNSAAAPEDGVYALYVWYKPGPSRAPDAHYSVQHAAGTSELTVDQRHHGVTWRYIGSYPLRAGQTLAVTLNNRSAYPGSNVVADAIRLGGGAFDSLTGIESDAPYPPDKPWWESAAYYHVQRLGVDPDDWPYFDDVVARPFWARWEHAETGDDAVYVSWHTNGYNGHNDRVWGTVSYIHNTQPAPGSQALQSYVHGELINDLRAAWDADWRDLGQQSRNLGEVRELWDDDPNLALPGVLLEIAYHDHISDTDALKDPRFALLSARAVYQGIVKYYAAKDGAALALLPEPPTHLSVRNAGAGQVGLSWRPSPSDDLGLAGQPAESYRVYTSDDGFAWDQGQATGDTHYTLSGLAPNQLIFVYVTAVNTGGESFPTPVLAARVSGNGSANILIVDGFDRIDRHGLIIEDDPVEGLNARLFADQINSFDYVVDHGMAIPYPFDSALNESVAVGDLNLSAYNLVDWFVGEEAITDHTFDAAEQAALAAYWEQGGGLFVSGAEIGWDLDIMDNGRDFYRQYLRAVCTHDDAGTYMVSAGGSARWIDRLRQAMHWFFPSPGRSAANQTHSPNWSQLGLIAFTDNYDADYPDQLTPLNSSAVLNYTGGLGGVAALQYDGGACNKLVYLAFPFETIQADKRSQVMSQVLGWFGDECLGPAAFYPLFMPIVFKEYTPSPPEPEPEPTNLIVNGDFESDQAWDLYATGYPAAFVASPVHNGQQAGRAQVSRGQYGYSSLAQVVELPDQAPLTLTLWYYPIYEEIGAGDLQYVSLTDAQGQTHLLWRTRQNDQQWLEMTLDLTAYRGQRVILRFGAFNDGDYNTAILVVDDIELVVVAE